MDCPCTQQTTLSPPRNMPPDPVPQRHTDSNPASLRATLRAFAPALALAVAGLTVACADAPTGPGTPAAGSAPQFSMTKAEEDSLKRVLEREKLRIDATLKASQRTYDSLKVEWERLNKTYPGGNPELLYCDPLQYAATTEIVGPEGKEFSFGPHKLRIPRGALTKHTVVTAEMPVALTVGAKFSPHGLKFARGATLTLSYKHCNRPTTWAEQVVYVDDAHTILERPFTVDRNSEGLADATIWHFSGYLMSTGRQRAF
jgi:hypothetical protein